MSRQCLSDGSGADHSLGSSRGLANDPGGPAREGALDGPLVELLRTLDDMFRGWARELGAVEYAFAPTIAASALERVDYFRAFPHLATFPVSLDRAPQNLRSFADRARCDQDGVLGLTATEPVREVLTPAACYHVYDLFQGQGLEAARLVTTRATCFRREAEYMALTRQRAFQMREIVCLGGRDEVEEFLGVMREWLRVFFAKAGLPVRLTPATDPFFAPERSAGYVMQKLRPLKLEMVLDGLAIGSLNRHEDRFGRAFGIRRGAKPAESACVAFGLERWLHVVRSRFGSDRRAWPTWLKEAAHG